MEGTSSSVYRRGNGPGKKETASRGPGILTPKPGTLGKELETRKERGLSGEEGQVREKGKMLY